MEEREPASTMAVAGAILAAPQPQPLPRPDPVSAASLYLKVQFDKMLLSTATGFVVEHEGRSYLVSANHVFSGRDANTGKCLHRDAAIPNSVRVAHRIQCDRDRIIWRFHGERLCDDEGKPRWFAHPRGPEVDVAALELANVKLDTLLTPIAEDLWNAELPLYPAMPVSIVGFPLGIRPGGVFLPVWKTGHIASEPDIDIERDRPAFWIDATTRKGMSGGPVIARSHGGYLSREGNWIVTERPMTRFIGVYSAHLHNVEVGVVWRPNALLEVLAARKPYVHP